MSDPNQKPTDADRQTEMDAQDTARADNSVEIKHEETEESMLSLESFTSASLVKLESLGDTETAHNVYDSQFDVFQQLLSSRSGEMDPLAVTLGCNSERITAPECVQQELVFDKSQTHMRGDKRGIEMRVAAGAAGAAEERAGPSRRRGRGRGNRRPQPIDESGTSLMRTAPKRGRDNHVNYGSEDDSEDEQMFPVVVSRVERVLFFDDDDDDDDDEDHQHEKIAETAQEPQDYMPRDLFHYDWVNFPSPAPTERRETFRAGEVGPTAVFYTPYEAFTAIWTPEFMQTIALETNRYAQQSIEQKIRDGTLGRLTRWKDTDVDELYVYFALLLATGACVKYSAKEYWTNADDIMSTPKYAKYMSYNRYVLLSSCLHFVDNKTDIQTMPQSKARVFKIQPVIQHLNDRFQALYKLGRNIAVDESLTQWKGWLAYMMLIKTKAAQAFVKTYELCDSGTGYLWRFKVYTGRVERYTELEITPRSGYIVSPVLELLKGLEDKGYTVWMDNFYNSPALARVMKSLGFDCAGTLRTKRPFVPQQIRKITANDMALGEVTGCTSRDVDILVWRDESLMAMISTYHGADVSTTRNKTKPNVVHDYNMCMGALDKRDRLLYAYPIERKCIRVWYKKFFKRLLSVSVFNAYILHRDCAVPDGHPHIRIHRDFRKALVAQLLERHHKNTIPARPEIKLTRKVVFSPTMLDHFPKQYGFVSNSTKKERIRHPCVVCHKPQSYYCEVCDVPLCLGDCIVSYHRKL